MLSAINRFGEAEDVEQRNKRGLQLFEQQVSANEQAHRQQRKAAQERKRQAQREIDKTRSRIEQESGHQQGPLKMRFERRARKRVNGGFQDEIGERQQGEDAQCEPDFHPKHPNPADGQGVQESESALIAFAHEQTGRQGKGQGEWNYFAPFLRLEYFG